VSERNDSQAIHGEIRDKEKALVNRQGLNTPGRRTTPATTPAYHQGKTDLDESAAQKWHNIGTPDAKLKRIATLWESLSSDQRAQLLAQAEAMLIPSDSTTLAEKG